MNLHQLECPLEPHFAEDLSSLLEEEALSISWFEKKPQNWTLHVIFYPSAESSLQGQIKAFFQAKKLPLPKITATPLPQEDWVSSVYQGFPPLEIGRFYIYGTHIQNPPPNSLIPLRIDAATAFGSGQHESTEGCLKALGFLAKEKSFLSPLDMGCGSGILAFAMASLWGAPVLACDCDPEAVRVTLHNAHINHLESLVEAKENVGFKGLAKQTFDIITANILAGPLCQMAGEATCTLKPGGYIILSGLLNRQANDVMNAYRSVGTKLVNQLFAGDWSTLIMRKELHD